MPIVGSTVIKLCANILLSFYWQWSDAEKLYTCDDEQSWSMVEEMQ
ncbi:MAG: hypothetical protein IPN82_12410 [Chitinophagaceae bacterium]|nr:hypothetical protein [Chitinophagaceae bacterium]